MLALLTNALPCRGCSSWPLPVGHQPEHLGVRSQDIKIGDLQRIAVLGSGAFGQVMLVKHEGKYMALKSLSKQQIVEMGLQVSCALLSACMQGAGCVQTRPFTKTPGPPLL